MSLFGETEERAVNYVADRLEDFEYGEAAAKTGTVAGLSGAGAALASNNVGLGVLSFAVGNFSHNVSTELASRPEYGLNVSDEEIEEMVDGELYMEDIDVEDIDTDYEFEKDE
ncbi:hypothetical protein [Candidatus Nanohalovita haloferacivicina]|uniref:hypothetical protein n=1 Tax=Candidatus Nanohalovita haloferacivicina TaxID=2978046 RepID=UPI00325FA617|nr:hypothetical protein HBNXNv_0963 [Candidatus Nanohalobia archaeon BNXNv]